MTKEWYTIRYRMPLGFGRMNEDQWYYHDQTQASLTLWTKGHADRIMRKYYRDNPTAEIILVTMV